MNQNQKEKVKCWLNPQDGYIEIGEPPEGYKGIEVLEMTPEEIHRWNEHRKVEILLENAGV